MITDRDREIINFIYEIGYCTINNIHSMYFGDSKYGYDLARKRLKKIIGEGYIKMIRNSETNENIYIPSESKLKKVSMHDLTTVNYLTELTKLGCKIEKVELEPVFGNIKPDALISFIFDGYRYWELLEIQIRHDMVDVDRFDGVFDKILDRTNNVMPKLVIVQNTNKDYKDSYKGKLDIIQLKLDMGEIAKVLI